MFDDLVHPYIPNWFYSRYMWLCSSSVKCTCSYSPICQNAICWSFIEFSEYKMQLYIMAKSSIRVRYMEVNLQLMVSGDGLQKGSQTKASCPTLRFDMAWIKQWTETIDLLLCTKLCQVASDTDTPCTCNRLSWGVTGFLWSLKISLCEDRRSEDIQNLKCKDKILQNYPLPSFKD